MKKKKKNSFHSTANRMNIKRPKSNVTWGKNEFSKLESGCMPPILIRSPGKESGLRQS